MGGSRYVLLFGLEEGAGAKVEAAAAGLPVEFIHSRRIKDIEAGDYFALVMDRAALGEAEAEQLRHFFGQVDGASTTKLFIGGEGDDLAGAARARVYPSVEALLPELGGILKKGYERARRQESLAVSFYIDEQVGSRPGVTTGQLARELERSEAAVRRYIEELQMAGRNIVYDDALRGWRSKDAWPCGDLFLDFGK